MGDQDRDAREQAPPKGGNRARATLGGDSFLGAVVESVSRDEAEKRNWAQAVVDNEDIVARFAAKVRQALRTVREARGLSVEAAADQVGVPASTLARLETGATSKIDLKLVARVALMLGVAPRLDFVAPGSTASVSVGDRETIRIRPEPSLVDGAPATGSTAQDPRILELRIRDLEARIAAVEHRRAETGD